MCGWGMRHWHASRTTSRWRRTVWSADWSDWLQVERCRKFYSKFGFCTRWQPSQGRFARTLIISHIIMRYQIYSPCGATLKMICRGLVPEPSETPLIHVLHVLHVLQMCPACALRIAVRERWNSWPCRTTAPLLEVLKSHKASNRCGPWQ